MVGSNSVLYVCGVNLRAGVVVTVVVVLAGAGCGRSGVRQGWGQDWGAASQRHQMLHHNRLCYVIMGPQRPP